MVQHHHGKGQCACPKLRMSAWAGPATTGWHEPILLAMPRSPAAARNLQEIVRYAGLRRELVLYAEGVMAHLEADASVTLAIGLERIAPMRVSPDWAAVARGRGAVVLLLGTMTVPEDMDVDVYLERHADEVVTGLVPVADVAIDRRCPAVAAFPDSFPLPWQSPAGRVQRREAR